MGGCYLLHDNQSKIQLGVAVSMMPLNHSIIDH
jgi:hypothetical protein